MKNYQEWYRNIRSRLTSRPILLFLLRSFNRLMTVAMPPGLSDLASHHLPATRTWSASWGLCAYSCIRFCGLVPVS